MINKWILEVNVCDFRLYWNVFVINYVVERVNIEFYFIVNLLIEFFILNLGFVCINSFFYFIYGLKMNVIKC